MNPLASAVVPTGTVKGWIMHWKQKAWILDLLLPLTAETTGSHNFRKSQFLYSSAHARSINTLLPPGEPKVSLMLPCLHSTAADSSPWGTGLCARENSESLCAYLQSIRVECGQACPLNSYRERLVHEAWVLQLLYSKQGWAAFQACLSSCKQS